MALYPLISLFSILAALTYDYDVFLSYRGSDERFKFVEHVHSALKNAKIRTFKDFPSISGGQKIDTEILRAIYKSRGAIVVLSKDFANSPFCLDEVVRFMERREPFGYIVFPIFYYVSPFEVGGQTGTFGAAFDEHEKKNIGRMGRVEKWRKALEQIAGLRGPEYPDPEGRDEPAFIQYIVRSYQEMLNAQVPKVSPNFTTWRDTLFIPGGPASLLGFLFIYGNQIMQAIRRRHTSFIPVGTALLLGFLFIYRNQIMQAIRRLIHRVPLMRWEIEFNIGRAVRLRGREG